MENQKPETIRKQITQNEQQLLDKYSSLIAQNTEQATLQAVADQLTHYELIGIQEGYRSAKQQVIAMMQEKLEALNTRNSEKIVELQANMGELPELDQELGLNAPSLEDGIDRAKQNYGVITSKDDVAELPSDLSSALDA